MAVAGMDAMMTVGMGAVTTVGMTIAETRTTAVATIATMAPGVEISADMVLRRPQPRSAEFAEPVFLSLARNVAKRVDPGSRWAVISPCPRLRRAFELQEIDHEPCHPEFHPPGLRNHS